MATTRQEKAKAGLIGLIREHIQTNQIFASYLKELLDIELAEIREELDDTEPIDYVRRLQGQIILLKRMYNSFFLTH